MTDEDKNKPTTELRDELLASIFDSSATTERDIRMIAADLHDQGRGHVLPDTIEGDTGTRPPDDTYSPRKLPIRDPEWRKAREKAKRKKCRTERRARMTDEQKAKQIGNLQLWKANNPEKLQAAESRRLEKEKAGRRSRFFVAVDLEGFDTGRYFTDDRRNHTREFHESIARGDGEEARRIIATFERGEPGISEEALQAAQQEQAELDRLLRDHIMISEEERLAQQVPFAGWTVHNRKWYLDQHDLTDDPVPSARNKKPGTLPIYIEHRPFLFGAWDDREQYFLDEDGEWTTDRARAMSATSTKKKALSGVKILNAIVDLKRRFGEAIFVTFAFGYDVAQLLPCLDADTAGKLQAGEIIINSVDDDGAPCEEVIEQAVFFWNEFAISYRRGKMFRVGRLNDPANPYKYKEITDPEEREDYSAAGREPVKREIDYKDKPVTLNDTFGFFQMSFIDAYEGSGISFTLEEAKIIFEGKRNRNLMASLPMDEVVQYQGMELRILCRMMDKLRLTTDSLGLILAHWQGAGSISMAMANKHRARDFYPSIRSTNYLPVQEWAHHCFAGGHIQMIMQGRMPGVSRNPDAVKQHEEASARSEPIAPEGMRAIGEGREEFREPGDDVRHVPPDPDNPKPDDPKLFGYDITSAYPSRQFILPAMALPIEWELKKDGSPGKVIKRIEGKWIWREGGELTEDISRMMSVYSMVEVEFSFPEKCFDVATNKLRDAPVYPLFYRYKDGSILFPAKGIGRYYRGETLRAFDWVRRMRSDMNETQQARMIKLRGAWEFVCPTIKDLTPEQLEAMKTKCPSARIGEDGLVYPFQYIKDYYDERARYPKTDARNQILKLGINGSWGKTAQSVGGRGGMPPGSASPWYAGVVTSETRAQVMDAVLNAPWNVIHIATDGIQSNAPLHIENKKKTLGGWEMDTFTGGGVHQARDLCVRGLALENMIRNQRLQ